MRPIPCPPNSLLTKYPKSVATAPIAEEISPKRLWLCSGSPVSSASLTDRQMTLWSGPHPSYGEIPGTPRVSVPTSNRQESSR
ncbi:hypothetical protein A0W34_30495 (plasmid) [Rhodococcus sp. BH4]|nr:hypothetical protein A0W34_30495 [Rhodococcus sp. BH4]